MRNRVALIVGRVLVGALLFAPLAGCAMLNRSGPPSPEVPAPGTASPGDKSSAAPGTPGAPSVPGPPPPKEEPTAYFTHTVKYPGESVSIVAGWYTGVIDNWKALLEANPGINPKRVVEGMKILVPENLMTTRKPMPKEFVDGFYPKPKPKPAVPKPGPPPPQEEPELFGPK